MGKDNKNGIKGINNIFFTKDCDAEAFFIFWGSSEKKLKGFSA
jgi:hypothetical protein